MSVAIPECDGDGLRNFVTDVSATAHVVTVTIVLVTARINELGHHVVIDQRSGGTDEPLVARELKCDCGAILPLIATFARHAGRIGAKQTDRINRALPITIDEGKGVFRG